jgi:hypothetical protein
MGWAPDWFIGVPITVLNVVAHVFGLALVSGVVASLAAGKKAKQGGILRFGAIISVVALLATILHAAEALVWAGLYWGLGACDDRTTAILYSLNAITSYGHESVTLERRWQLLGAIEAVNGMMLFGLTTAFLFAMIHRFRIARI